MPVEFEITLVCNKCGDKLPIGDFIYSGNPEYYTFGFSVHEAHENDWVVNDTDHVLCNNCK